MLFFSIIQRRPDFVSKNSADRVSDPLNAPAYPGVLPSPSVPSLGKGARPCELAAAGAVGAGALEVQRPEAVKSGHPASRTEGVVRVFLGTRGDKGVGRRPASFRGSAFASTPTFPPEASVAARL
jgi:hypothetical protein